MHLGRTGVSYYPLQPSTSVVANAPVAQRIEHLTTDQKVGGSNPSGRAEIGCWRTTRYRDGVSRLERITTDPAVCHGQPTVRGLRYPVSTLLELLSSGMSIQEVLDDYPDLERDDLLAALEFGALTAGGGRVVPLGAA